jgi:hypothetical protein
MCNDPRALRAEQLVLLEEALTPDLASRHMRRGKFLFNAPPSFPSNEFWDASFAASLSCSVLLRKGIMRGGGSCI